MSKKVLWLVPVAMGVFVFMLHSGCTAECVDSYDCRSKGNTQSDAGGTVWICNLAGDGGALQVPGKPVNTCQQITYSFCSAATCPNGCCDPTAPGLNGSSGACVAGTADTACGAAGGTCTDCTQMSGTCTAQACVVPCNATTCATGCCDSTNTCQMGITNAACGTGGAACAACTGAQMCDATQTCSTPVMDAGTTDAGTTDAGSSLCSDGGAHLSDGGC